MVNAGFLEGCRCNKPIVYSWLAKRPAMNFPQSLIALSLAVASLPALAATVTVQVRDAQGVTVPNAVVTVHLEGRPTPPPRRVGAYAIEQRNIQFNPFVTIVPIGADVSFPNRDKVRHHVYSFSQAKKFELKLYATEQNRNVRFDKPGIVPLGCNIHDQMSAFVAVVDTPWATQTDTSGVARLDDVPGGVITITVWHPFLRAPGNRVTRTIRIADAASVSEAVTVTLRAAK